MWDGKNYWNFVDKGFQKSVIAQEQDVRSVEKLQSQKFLYKQVILHQISRMAQSVKRLGFRLEKPGNRRRIPGTGRYFYFLQSNYVDSDVHLAYCSVG